MKANLILRAVEVLSLNYWLYFRLLLALPSRCDFPFCNNILPKILAMQTEEVGNKQGGQGEAKMHSKQEGNWPEVTVEFSGVSSVIWTI